MNPAAKMAIFGLSIGLTPNPEQDLPHRKTLRLEAKQIDLLQ